MGLDIVSSDYEVDFNIGYSGFTKMRSYFVLHYGLDLYEDYFEFIKYIVSCVFFNEEECPIDEQAFNKSIGDLSILTNHSDCDGLLTSDECKLLKDCLFVDEEKIRQLPSHNEEYRDMIINKMYDFVDLINYCAEHEDVKLIFG